MGAPGDSRRGAETDNWQLPAGSMEGVAQTLKTGTQTGFFSLTGWIKPPCQAGGADLSVSPVCLDGGEQEAALAHGPRARAG